MTIIEVIGLITSSGVLTGGVGILRWSMIVERRLTKLELINEVQTHNRRSTDRNRRATDHE